MATKAQPAATKVTQSSFEPHIKELSLAYQRMNSSPVKRLEWLVRFALDEDVSSLSFGQLSDRRWEFLMFLSQGTKPEDLAQSRDATLFLTLLPRPDFNLMTELNWQSGGIILKRFHADMKANLAAMFTEAGWSRSIEERILAPRIYSGSLLGGPGVGASSYERAIDIAFELVKAHRERLRRCEHCNKIFVEKRKGRAKFCGKRCSTYVKLKNWRAEHKRSAKVRKKKKVAKKAKA